MSKYINYERIEGSYDQESIKDLFKYIVEKGWDIIYYNELNNNSEALHVIVVCGIPNSGKKSMLLD
ncbi:MAG: hypothetical protein U9Q27_01585 [Patescibacteria group bacterium]|nr:hypothetical protein [Patescibacteria group bacterium]